MIAVASERRWRRRRVVAILSLSVAGVGVPDGAADADDGVAEEVVHASDLVNRLFVQEGTSLVRLARLFTDDRDAAEDIVQEAFIRLHRSSGRLRDGSKAEAYLRSIVLNLARDHNRRGLMSLRHRMSMAVSDRVSGVEDAIVDSDAHQHVVDILRDLPLRQRDCLVLRYYFEMTEREAASVLGISQSSVKTHCRRGLATMEKVAGDAQ